MLIESLGCGSIGWPSGFFLASHAGVRLVFVRDPCHPRFNRLKAPVKASGLWPIWLEGSIVFRLTKAPWAGAAHFASMSAAAKNYVSAASPKDPLFLQI